MQFTSTILLALLAVSPSTLTAAQDEPTEIPTMAPTEAPTEKVSNLRGGLGVAAFNGCPGLDSHHANMDWNCIEPGAIMCYNINFFSTDYQIEYCVTQPGACSKCADSSPCCFDGGDSKDTVFDDRCPGCGHGN